MPRPRQDEEIKSETMGGRVKIIRRAMGLKQSEFAKLLGIRQPVLSQIENNLIVLGGDLIAKLCEFGYPADWIVEGKQSQPLSWEQLIHDLDKMGIPRDDRNEQGLVEIFNLLRTLTSEQISYIRGIAVGMCEANRVQEAKKRKQKQLI